MLDCIPKAGRSLENEHSEYHKAYFDRQLPMFAYTGFLN